jgi:hypothetical protein
MAWWKQKTCPVAVMSATLLLAGCGATPVSPPTLSSAELSIPQLTRPQLAPRVSHPLSVENFRADPCSSLSSGQLAQWLGPEAKPKPDINGPGGQACLWIPADGFPQPNIGVLYGKLRGNGLNDAYVQKDDVEYFKEMDPIQGYPVVLFNQKDYRSRGECEALVGVSDQQDIQVTTSQASEKIGKEDPCVSTYNIAADVISNLLKVR